MLNEAFNVDHDDTTGMVSDFLESLENLENKLYKIFDGNIREVKNNLYIDASYIMECNRNGCNGTCDEQCEAFEKEVEEAEKEDVNRI
jgi:hypothetical protein